MLCEERRLIHRGHEDEPGVIRHGKRPDGQAEANGLDGAALRSNGKRAVVGAGRRVRGELDIDPDVQGRVGGYVGGQAANGGIGRHDHVGHHGQSMVGLEQPNMPARPAIHLHAVQSEEACGNGGDAGVAGFEVAEGDIHGRNGGAVSHHDQVQSEGFVDGAGQADAAGDRIVDGRVHVDFLPWRAGVEVVTRPDGERR